LEVLTLSDEKTVADRVLDALRIPRHFKKHPFPARHSLGWACAEAANLPCIQVPRYNGRGWAAT